MDAHAEQQIESSEQWHKAISWIVLHAIAQLTKPKEVLFVFKTLFARAGDWDKLKKKLIEENIPEIVGEPIHSWRDGCFEITATSFTLMAGYAYLGGAKVQNISASSKNGFVDKFINTARDVLDAQAPGTFSEVVITKIHDAKGQKPMTHLKFKVRPAVLNLMNFMQSYYFSKASHGLPKDKSIKYWIAAVADTYGKLRVQFVEVPGPYNTEVHSGFKLSEYRKYSDQITPIWRVVSWSEERDAQSIYSLTLYIQKTSKNDWRTVTDFLKEKTKDASPHLLLPYQSKVNGLPMPINAANPLGVYVNVAVEDPYTKKKYLIFSISSIERRFEPAIYGLVNRSLDASRDQVHIPDPLEAVFRLSCRRLSLPPNLSAVKWRYLGFGLRYGKVSLVGDLWLDSYSATLYYERNRDKIAMYGSETNLSSLITSTKRTFLHVQHDAKVVKEFIIKCRALQASFNGFEDALEAMLVTQFEVELPLD